VVHSSNLLAQKHKFEKDRKETRILTHLKTFSLPGHEKPLY
jgi:hypothetical protein